MGMGKLTMHCSSPVRAKRRSIICLGPVYVSSAFGPTIASGYELMGTADFNGNGKPDDVLYNASTRRTALYYLNNNVLGCVAPILPAGWNLVAP